MLNFRKWNVKKVHQVKWDSVIDYDRIGQWIKALAEALDIAYQDISDEFAMVCCVRGHEVT